MKKLNLLLEYLQSSLHCPIYRWKQKNGRWINTENNNDQLIPSDFASFHLTPASPPLIIKNKQSDAVAMILINYQQAIIMGPWKSSDRYVTNQNWVDAVCLIYNYTHHQQISRAQLLQQSQQPKEQFHLATKNYQAVFADRECDFIHNPYGEERRELQAITEGNAAKLRAALSESFPGKYATLSNNQLRSFKNLAIVDLALVSRAAIQGGLDYENACSLCDSYIRAVDQARSQDEIANLLLTAKFNYQQIVASLHQHKEQQNSYIYRVEDYITIHLHHKITVKEIAEYLGITPKYLSTIFKRAKKCSLKYYINQQKILASQKELIYSQTAITTIAANYQFSSVSYYAITFKSITKMTPHEYRQRYQNCEKNRQ